MAEEEPVNYRTLIERVLSHEGGYVNDLRDPGGETKFGISKRSYPDVDIKNLTREAAIAIYKQDYWDKLQADRFPPAVAYQLLDSAVNSGIGQSIRFVQRAVGVADDGVIGPVTLAKLLSTDPHDVVMKFLAERLDFLARLNKFDVFGRGWVRRIADNLRYGADDA